MLYVYKEENWKRGEKWYNTFFPLFFGLSLYMYKPIKAKGYENYNNTRTFNNIAEP